MSSLLNKYRNKTTGRIIEVHIDTDPTDPREQFDECSDETYEAWRNGEVFGFIAYDPKTCEHCNSPLQENEDSCWGFYGDDKAFMLEEAGITNEDDWEELKHGPGLEEDSGVLGLH